MTKEDRNLLVQDLCSRLPYGVKVLYKHSVFDIDYISSMYEEVHLDIVDNYTIGISEVKPYLFLFFFMTEEQYKEYWELEHNGNMEHLSLPLLEWLNKNHFDYRDLIPKGLAIDCTNLNIY